MFDRWMTEASGGKVGDLLRVLTSGDELNYKDCAMNAQCSTDSLVGKTEILCETIIEALRELRSGTNGPVTPSLLSRSLIKNASYLETLNAAARWTGSNCDPVDMESYAVSLKQFQIKLMNTFEDAFSEDWDDCGRDLLVLAGMKSQIDEVFQLNARILAFVDDICGKAVLRQKQLFDLLAEVARNLVEVEHFLSISLSSTRKLHDGSKAFIKAFEQNVENMHHLIENARNLDELKALISSELEAVKQASRKKLELEEILTVQAAEEIEALRSQIRNMRKQVSKAQRQAEYMERASLIDPLTGVANRRAYQKFIRNEWNAYTNTREPFSILMIDIDNFKFINDRFGHWAGDKCLAELARRISVNLRGTDFLARYGGEEFIAVLPRTVRSGAVAVAEKLRAFVEQTRFLYRKERIPLTISIGVSTVRDADQNIRAVQDRVDKGLYDAKKNGRNYVSIA